MELNDTIKTQLNHRTIRAFKNQPLTPEEVTLLVDVARHTATSNFLQGSSIISITDPTLKQAIADISKQPYVAHNGHLFVFVIDQHRNTQIATAQGRPANVQGTTDRFIASLTDAVIAAQNMVVAAESMGMGTVYLGSIFNDTERLIELLHLPDYTFPAVGLAVGWPDQEPQLKPRLPRDIIHMENHYQPLANPMEELAAYDDTITLYYDMRNMNTRVDSFTKQIGDKMESLPAKRMEILSIAKKQGFMNE